MFATVLLGLAGSESYARRVLKSLELPHTADMQMIALLAFGAIVFAAVMTVLESVWDNQHPGLGKWVRRHQPK